MRGGLPYGWWKDLDFWALVWGSLFLGVTAALLLWAWFA